MIFGNNIRKRVLVVVEERIASGQKEFNDLVAREDQMLAEGISALTLAHTRNKLGHESRIVSGIVS